MMILHSKILIVHCYHISNLYCITKETNVLFCDTVFAQHIKAVHICTCKVFFNDLALEITKQIYEDEHSCELKKLAHIGGCIIKLKSFCDLINKSN